MTHSDLDACLRLVADRHRRRIIHYLRDETDRVVTVERLVDRVHGNGFAAEGDPPPDPERIAIQLHQIHLPKLADHGVVDFDPRSGDVRYRSDERLEQVLDSLSGVVWAPE
jgi:DNA-binding transcriptional ArsR family regulator